MTTQKQPPALKSILADKGAQIRKMHANWERLQHDATTKQIGATEAAIKYGIFLTNTKAELKAEVGPKHWQEWLQLHCDHLALRTCRLFMQLADYVEQMPDMREHAVQLQLNPALALLKDAHDRRFPPNISDPFKRFYTPICDAFAFARKQEELDPEGWTAQLTSHGVDQTALMECLRTVQAASMQVAMERAWVKTDTQADLGDEPSADVVADDGAAIVAVPEAAPKRNGHDRSKGALSRPKKRHRERGTTHDNA
jgi:hypothetical protein